MSSIEAYPHPSYKQAKVIESLKKAATNELLTCALYQQVEQRSQKTRHARLRNLAHSGFKEDLDHFRKLRHCIDQLENESNSQSVPPSLNLLTPETDSPNELLNLLEQAELTSISLHQEICAMTIGYDYKVFDLAYALLNENMQHNLLVKQYLTDGA